MAYFSQDCLTGGRMLKDNWFTEVCEESATAFSLRVQEKIHEEKTPYQTISIYETEKFGKLMVIDGCTMVSDRDNFLYHEMMSHPVLFSHPDPKNVVIIGGGDCGTLQQVLLHELVTTVKQIEIDERVTRLSEKYFPQLCSNNNDSRVELLFIDGIQWMANAATDSVDVVIVDSTDPVGPAEGLFSETFYRHCHRVLGTDGLLVQQSESPLVHMDIIKAMYASMSAAGFFEINTLNFPQCIYPTGWWSATIAGKIAGKDVAGKNAAGNHSGVNRFRKSDAQQKSFKTNYYNAEIHQAALAVPEFFKREIEGK